MNAADPKRPYKAYASTAMTLIGTFVGQWIIDTGTFTPKEIAAALLVSAASAGLTGGATFFTRNPRKP